MIDPRGERGAGRCGGQGKRRGANSAACSVQKGVREVGWRTGDIDGMYVTQGLAGPADNGVQHVQRQNPPEHRCECPDEKFRPCIAACDMGDLMLENALRLSIEAEVHGHDDDRAQKTGNHGCVHFV